MEFYNGTEVLRVLAKSLTRYRKLAPIVGLAIVLMGCQTGQSLQSTPQTPTAKTYSITVTASVTGLPTQTKTAGLIVQ